MKNGILTTAQAADLLGVSVRTAQLWIEAGALPSWKTPGGHRRVRRADVETLLPSTNLRKTFKTALTVVITDRDRFAFYRELVQSVEGCAVEIYDSIVAAAKTISVRLPLVIVVDMSTSARDRAELLRELATDPQLGHTLVIAVTGSTSSASHARFGGTSRLEFIKPDAVLQRLALRIRTHLTHGFSEQQAVDNQLSAFPVPPNEKTRAEAVVASGLLDTAPEAAFDRVTWLATQFLSMPVSLITLLTPTRQWFQITPWPRCFGNPSRMGLLQLHVAARWRVLFERPREIRVLREQSCRYGRPTIPVLCWRAHLRQRRICVGLTVRVGLPAAQAR